MTRPDRKLLSRLEQAHRLARQERRLLRRLLTLYGIDGRDGPATSPAMVFFRPSYWKVFENDARGGGDRKLKVEEIERLRMKLFGGSQPAGLGSEAGEREGASRT